MKLATYIHQGSQSFGTVTPGGIVDIPSRRHGAPATLLEALQRGPDELLRIAELAAAPGPTLPLANVKLLAPLPCPPKILAMAVNYAEHHREFNRGQDLPDDPSRTTTPRPFIMPSTCVIGPGETIPWPCYSRQVDHEVELAVVIGAKARCVSPAQARERVAGYTICNDVSARSVTYSQGRQPRPKDDFFDWLHGKWSDGFCPMGPWMVTADEVGSVSALNLELTVNGEVRQRGKASQMIFDVYELVSFCSHLMTLVPGDVIATGTPSGVAMATGKWLKPGDVVTCRIDRIGELTNTIGPEPGEFYAPCAAAPGDR